MFHESQAPSSWDLLDDDEDGLDERLKAQKDKPYISPDGSLTVHRAPVLVRMSVTDLRRKRGVGGGRILTAALLIGFERLRTDPRVKAVRDRMVEAFDLWDERSWDISDRPFAGFEALSNGKPRDVYVPLDKDLKGSLATVADELRLSWSMLGLACIVVGLETSETLPEEGRQKLRRGVDEFMRWVTRI